MTDKIESLAKAVDTVKDRLEKLGNFEDTVKGYVQKTFGLDANTDYSLPDLMNKIDELDARHDRLQQALQNSRHGAYVPGLEDEAQSFNLVKAMVAIKTGDEKKAPREMEVMRACHARMVSLGIIAGDDHSSGAFIPDQVIPDVIEPYYARSAFISLDGEKGETRISVIDGLNGQHVKIPEFQGGMVAYWVGEEDEYAESEIKTSDKDATPRKLGVLARLTDEQIRWASYGMDRLFRRDMVKALVKKTDWTVAYGGGGANVPRGICNTDNIRVYAASSDHGEGVMYDSIAAANAANANWDPVKIHWDYLDDIDLHFEESDVDSLDISSVSSPRAFRYLKNRKVLQAASLNEGDQPYLIPEAMVMRLTSAQLREYVGDFGWTSQIGSNQNPGVSIGGADSDNDAKCTDFFRGDMSQVLFLRWGGMDIVSDEGRGKGFTSDHTYIKARMYCDVMVRDPRAVAVCPNFQVRN